MDDTAPFVFDGYEVAPDRKSLSFRYQLVFKGVLRIFREEIRLPEPVPAEVPERLVSAVMQSLLLVLGLSYWKISCLKEMKINGFVLSHEQAEFWNTVYTKGLGEFYFRNKLDYKKLVNFPHSPGDGLQPSTIVSSGNPLLGIAGGKDSLLSAKLLQEVGIPFTALVVEKESPFPLIEEVAPLVGAPLLRIKRIIDPQLFELNGQGAYNGHIPISAVYAFLGFAAACFYGYSAFIVSNEKSANYGNVNYLGMEVNHQWSKSEEFELMFRKYIMNITPDVSYFSLLRPLNELQITERFVRNQAALPHFSSCNKNFKIHGEMQGKKWCGECPKCAFVFALLAAFLPKDRVSAIFGKNLFEDQGLVQTYRQLLGVAEFKPFECVGTPDEVKAAFLLAHRTHEYDATPAMGMFMTEVEPHVADTEAAIQSELTVGSLDALPEKYRQVITPK